MNHGTPFPASAMEQSVDLFDSQATRDLIVETFRQALSSVARALPIALAVIVGLVVAWLASHALGWVAARALRKIGLDTAAEKLAITPILRRAGATRAPSALVGRAVFWALFLAVLASIVDRLGLESVGEIVDRVVSYVPTLIAATVILLAGLVLGRFGRNLVSANLEVPTRVGRAVQAGVVVVASVIALEQLGVNTDLMVLVITVVVGATGTTMGVAFALGARPVVTHILAGHFLRRTLTPGTMVDVAGRRGQVERVGPTETVFRMGERSWSMPNARLMDEIVDR